MSQIAMVLLGIAAIALAIVVDDHEALATMLGAAGMAAAVLGLLLPQLEGDIEFSAKGLKAKLRQARSVLTDDTLTRAEKTDVLSELLQVEGIENAASQSPVGGQFALSVPAFDWPEPPAPGTVSLRHVGRDLAGHVRRAFEDGGWTVVLQGRRVFGDFIAEKDDQRRLVEVKAARHLSAADIAEMLARRVDDESDLPPRWVLAVPENALSRAAVRLADETLDLDIVYVPLAGTSGSSHG